MIKATKTSAKSSGRKVNKFDLEADVKDAATSKHLSPRPWRFVMVIGIMIVTGCFLSFRALEIQVLENEFLQEQGEARHLRTVSLPAHRGMILDRNDEVLAMSTPVDSVWANPKVFSILDPNLGDLAALLDMSEATIKRVVENKKNKEFVYFKRHISPALAEKVSALKISGVYMQREYRRYYPTAEVMSHVIGFTNIDDVGIEGVERQLNTKLQGEPGKNKVLKDRKGRVIESVDLIEAPQPGNDVHLSVDKRLQYIAYRDLKKTVKEHGAKSGNLVILDVNTGEVLAMVNEPAYNPNLRGNSNRGNANQAALRNRAVIDLYEPGSTIKPFIVAAALKTRQFSPETPVMTSPGYMRVGKATIRDVHDYGELDITGIIRKSSNVGITKIALALQPEELWESLSDMGFGELSRSEFPGEANGYLPFFGEWKDLTQATVSFGYGVSVTSLQLAQSYAVLANGGFLKPVSLERVDLAPQGRQVISREVSRKVMAMMETVVSRDGTAIRAKVPGYRVAGKTGTVKKIDPNGGYLDNHYLSVFAGIAPASNPQFAVVVMIDDPSNGDYYGGEVAAPLFSSVVGEALRIMNVAPDDIPVSLAESNAKPTGSSLTVARLDGVQE